MAPAELLDARVKVDQCKLAVKALHEYQSKKDAESAESELLGGKDQNIWLNVAVKKMPSQKKLMPVRIPVVHPLVDPRTSSVCLITKDPQREYKELLETNNIKFVSRVIGISKLKGKFKPFEARRILLKENGLFLADDRVIPLLPKLLGEKWFKAKKQPIPVTLTRKDLKKELEYAIQSTYMNQNRGTNTAIKIGTMAHSPDEILANLKSALPVIAQRISGGWDNIQAFSIKTNSSVSLPIWSCSLEDTETGRFAEKLAEAEPVKKRKREDEEKKVAAALVGTPEKKKKKTNSPVSAKDKAPEQVDDVPAAEASAPKMKKGKKSDTLPVVESTAEPAPSKKDRAISSAPAVQENLKETTKKSKPKSVGAEVIPAPLLEEPKKDETLKESTKKSKRKSAAAETVTIAVVEEATEKEVKKEVKKSSKKAQKVAEISTNEGAKPKKTVSKETDVELPSKPAQGKKPKEKRAGNVSAEDLKQKKTSAPGEKKKEKVIKGKTGKSAKEGLIGKKGLTH